MIEKLFITAALTLALLINFHSSAQQVHEPANTPPPWSLPYEPFCIIGNLYYVGTYDLACYLIATPKGNILINTGLAASTSIIKGNIEKLGFKFADTKILLTTQAHHDHLGAMAEIKKLTGARLMVDEKDAGVVADGGNSDYAFGNHGSTFAPVIADRLLKNGDTITLDNVRLAILHHPGHTKGSCSYLMDVRKDKYTTYRVLIANMPTIVTDKKFSDISSYPEIASDYAYTFNALKTISFHIWLSSHASQFNLHTKHKPGDAYNPEAFIDQKGYSESLRDLESSYLKKVSGE